MAANNVSRRATGTLKAIPNPIAWDELSCGGVTSLTWDFSGAEVIEVHVDSPDGPILCQATEPGTAMTGAWVTDGMTFYLQDVTGGKALTAENTLASVAVAVTRRQFEQEPNVAVLAGGKKVLVIGWFSFEQMGATAGDIVSKDLACQWLMEAGCAFDVALAHPFGGGVNWQAVAPQDYAVVLFVCGPFVLEPPLPDLLQRFAHCKLAGLNVTVLEDDAFQRFDLLIERDSPRATRPDMSFQSSDPRVPLAGIILVEPQHEYGPRAMHHIANGAIHGLVARHPLAVVHIDTRLDYNQTGLRSAAEVESLIARMDVVVTTRLHGLVFALKNGVPAIAVDAIDGGAKVSQQARIIGWPVVFTLDQVSDKGLDIAYHYCLTAEARARAQECARRACQHLQETQRLFETILPQIL